MSTDAPKVLVIFGGTGDLFQRKVAPSLFTLFEEGKFPSHLYIIGTGRSDHSHDSYRNFVSGSLYTMLSVTPPDSFLSRFFYVHGDVLSPELFVGIEQYIAELETEHGQAAELVWYYSIGPDLYETISHGIATHTTLLQRAPELTSVLIEKPIGHDGASSAQLNSAMQQYFDESQIVRIEHYLTKETLLQIPSYRKTHPALESLLSAEHIARIDVTFHETIGVEKRGAFYDTVGALRDVGQNHVLEMLAITCAQLPHTLSTELLQASRIQFLESLPVYSSAEAGRRSARFQYSGYETITGVKPGSTTETAYRTTFELSGKRWGGTTVVASAGKRMAKKEKRIVFTCKPGTVHEGKTLTHVVVSIDPEQVEYVYETESVVDQFRPGHVAKYQYVEEYARILDAAFRHDTQYSVSAREVAAFWRFTDQFLTAWSEQKTPLQTYQPDTTPSDILEQS